MSKTLQFSYPEESRKRLGSGTAWGCFHEIGHNLQESRWMPTDTVEVTSNIFPIMINNKVIYSITLGGKYNYAMNSILGNCKAIQIIL